MSTFPDSQPSSEPGIPSGAPIEIVGQDARSGEREAVQPQAPPYIAFEHVSKSFGDVHVLDDVSFSVQAGETLCILGRSGVGKSVSLQQIMGFLKPDSGRIMVAGQDITGFTENQMETVRKKVTMVQIGRASCRERV
jgi:phospholipid/cholesterol/gamma-HCH transport system ATP-binding protein